MTGPVRLNIDDLDYIFGYFSELSPAYLAYCAALNGYRFEKESNPRYLELGFGQGVSLNIHAAACPGAFWGNDLAPKHVAFARMLAGASGAPVSILEESFQQMAERDDLPEFDIIVLHGIWTWISNENRAVIVDLARRKLAPGGLLYVSYNCLASWAPLLPVRKLMIAHAKADPVDRPLTEKVRNALEFVQTLIRNGALHFKFNPIVAVHLENLGKRDNAYLAHEFFSHAWEPTSFTDVADQLSEAGLSYIGTTAMLENVDAFWIGDAGRKAVSEANPTLREGIREMFANTHFRKDVFAKRPVGMTQEEQEAALLRRRFALGAPVTAIPLEVSGPQGTIVLDPRHFEPLLFALAAESYAPKSIAQLCAATGKTAREIADQLNMLAGGAYVHVASADSPDEAIQNNCRQLNRFIQKNTEAGGSVRVLASPVVGGGVKVSRIEQFFLSAIQRGANGAQEVADAAWTIIEQKRASTEAPADRATVRRMAEHFVGETHLLKSLGII